MPLLQFLKYGHGSNIRTFVKIPFSTFVFRFLIRGWVFLWSSPLCNGEREKTVKLPFKITWSKKFWHERNIFLLLHLFLEISVFFVFYKKDCCYNRWTAWHESNQNCHFIPTEEEDEEEGSENSDEGQNVKSPPSRELQSSSIVKDPSPSSVVKLEANQKAKNKRERQELYGKFQMIHYHVMFS